MKRIKILLLILIPTLIFAFNKSGQQAMQFLELEMGARGCGMGGAFVAISDDMNSTYYNPAGLSQIKNFGATVTHLKYFCDINYEYIGIAKNFGQIGVIGLTGGMLFMSEMDKRTPFHPEGDGTKFSASDMLIGLSYAKNLTNKFSVGLTLKFIREELDDVSGNTWAADIGTKYDTGWKDIRIGMAIKDFGANVSYLDKEEYANAYSSALPNTFRMGIAKDWMKGGQTELTTSLEMLHTADSGERGLLGLEARFAKLVAVRGGFIYAGNSYNNSEEKSEDEKGSETEFGDTSGMRAADMDFTFGVGFKLNVGNKNLKIDYAFTHFKYLAPEFMDNPHRVTLSLEF